MLLRFNTLTYTYFNSIFLRKILLILLLLTFKSVFYGQSNLEEVKKEADRLFEEDEFTKAYKLYAQLVSNYPKDPVYTFKLGVCMIYSEPDKKKSIPYLQYANSKAEEAPRETKFYLGKAFHINYKFDEAIKYYNEYKKVGSAAKQKKLQVDQEIRACGNGKRLLSNLSDLVVQSKKTLNEGDYFRSYDLRDIGGKLLVKPEEFKTSQDKKKKDKSVLYLHPEDKRLYYSSYGPNTETGKDIYYKTKLPNGEYTPPQKAKGINTEFDEDYPFLHPNGNILYFASKGFNSMGGYDIFKSTYMPATDSWTQPENLEFPINSPDDDFLFVTDSLQTTAYFSTGRQSLPGKIDVLRISTIRKPIDILSLKGTVVKESADQSLKCKVTVKNMDNGEVLGTYLAQDNGDYLMDLPNGSKLLFTVETPGQETQSERVLLPLVNTSKALRQTIAYEKGILKIINYFDEATTDESYVQYLKLIEEKSKLDVNVGENKFNGIAENDSLKNVSSNVGPSVTEDTTGTKTVVVNTKTVAETPTKGVDNKQLAEIAKQDAEESKKEANALQQDANDGFELGEFKKIEATKKINEGEDAFKNAQAITDDSEKKIAEEKAIAIKTEGENELKTANKILDYAKSLNEDAKNKQSIADLNQQYAKELENLIATKNKNPDALNNLANLQKKIDEASVTKNSSENAYNAIKNETEEKEKEVSKIEQSNNELKTTIQEIKSTLATTESELASAKKKKDKEPLQAKVDELKIELAEKEKQLAGNEIALTKAKEEFNANKNDLDIANRIKNETIAKPIASTTTAVNTNTNAIATNNPSPNPAGEKITNKSLSEKYQDKIIVNDEKNKSNLEESNIQLKNYTIELDAAIAKNKKDLAKAKTPAQKQAINTEIKQLDAAKKQNSQLIASNNISLSEIDNSIAKAALNPGPDLTPLESNTNKDVIEKLNSLDKKLNSSDNANFEFNGYQNSQAQTLKIEADAKINEAAAQQKKLKETIANTTEQIKNLPPSTNKGVNQYENLNNEAHSHFVKAHRYRYDAEKTPGVNKDSLVALAVIQEQKADEKHMAAAKLMENDNKADYETNKENLSTLLELNKASEEDKNEVKRLVADAKIAYKQAASIRMEADAMPNIKAKLGNYSNADEKETEAIQKQEEALTLLKKNSGDVALKTAEKSATTPTIELKAPLQNLNNGIAELAETKITAYQKLYEANKIELEQINSNLKPNQSFINNNVSLKNNFTDANYKTVKAASQKLNSESEPNNNKKLSELIAATRLQVEAINELNTLSKKLPVAVIAANTNTTTENPGNEAVNTNTNTGNAGNETVNTNTNTSNAGNETVNTNTNTSNAGNETVNTNTNTGNETVNTNTNTGIASNETVKTNTNTENAGNETVSTNTNTGNPANETVNTNTNTANSGNETVNTNTNTSNAGNETVNTNTNTSNETVNTNTNTGNSGNENDAVTTKTVDVNELAKQDTSATQVLNYFENNKIALKNPGANQLAKNTIAELKKIEEENKQIEEQLKTAPDVSSNSGQTPAQVKSKAEDMIADAENMSIKAFEAKSLAGTKQDGAEKDSLMAISKNLEEQSNTKKLQATTLTDQANQTSFDSNKNTISELVAKAKTDNPDLASSVEQKNNNIAALKNQAQQLREEANAQSNSSAKIGSLMNAEEKEAEMLQIQHEVIEELKKQYPDYVVKEPIIGGNNVASTEELKEKQAKVQDKQYTELTKLTNAFSLEYETSKTSIPQNLNNNQKAIKQNAEELNAESKRLLIKSVSETNPKEKVKLLTLAAKTGNASVEQLNKITPIKAAIAKNNPKNNNVVAKNNPKNNNTSANNNPNNENTDIVVAVDNTPKNNTAAKTNKAKTNKNKNDNVAANNNPNNENTDIVVAVDNTPKNNPTAKTNKTKTNKNKNNNVAANNNPNNENTNIVEAVDNTPKNNTTGRGTVKIEGLEVIAGNAYSEVKPIPIDAEIPSGLHFRVQIGAFRNTLPNNTFRGLNPLNAENSAKGWIRYTAGDFSKIEKANAVKNDLQRLGYNDAFVVVYYNGKRISLNEALDIMANEGKVVDPNAPTSAGITTNANVPKANNNPTNANLGNSDPVKITNELEKINGLLFTVQIGVYTKQVVGRQLFGLQPIFSEKLPTGYYRYTAGIYIDTDRLKTDKARVVNLGIRDAFISAYINGKRITFAEGVTAKQDAATKMETENPIIFPEGGAINNTPVNNTPLPNNTPVNNTPEANPNPVKPFTNNVSSYPEATPDNGVKTTQDGVCFKVQIGAYSKQIPNDVAAKFSAIKNWPIENKQINSLYIYNVGNYTAAKFARTLLNEAKANGITDAFISVYKEGQKVTGAEAAQLLNQ